jgi:cystathionine gamma-synthase
MTDFGGMLSILVQGDEIEARKVVNAVKIICTSYEFRWRVESLIEHRASVEGPDTKTPKEFNPDLCRIRAYRRP